MGKNTHATAAAACWDARRTPLEARLRAAAEAIAEADAIVVGGGAGLSTAAGLPYAGPAWEAAFAEGIARYHYADMYSASFYPYATAEETWAFNAAHTKLALLDQPAYPLYGQLRQLVERKPCFVITTNVEEQFPKAGFREKAFFEVQGSLRYIQCARGCHAARYDFRDLAAKMAAATRACRVPADMVPACPVCGGPMDMNLRKDAFFVQDALWYGQAQRYEQFLNEHAGGRVVLLELGVGYNTPGIIRYPFEQLAFSSPHATLVRLNAGSPEGSPDNREKTIAFTEDMGSVVQNLLGRTAQA